MTCGKGKPKDPVWGFYSITGVGKDKIATYKECDSVVSAKHAKSDRLRNHQMKCPKQVAKSTGKSVLSAPLCQPGCRLTVPDECVFT